MSKTEQYRDNLLGVLGAIVGAFVGNFLFHLIVQQGFYAMVIPGALTGYVVEAFQVVSRSFWVFSVWLWVPSREFLPNGSLLRLLQTRVLLIF